MIELSVIVVICYVVAELYKSLTKDVLYKYIPLITCSLGGILGMIVYYTSNSFIGNSLVEVVLMGMISGLSSTGTNQIIKQLFKKEDVL